MVHAKPSHNKLPKEPLQKKRIHIPVALLETPNDINLDDDFKTNILAKLRDDEVGRLCQTDHTILQIGSVFYR